MSSLRQRLLTGLGANAYGQVINVGIQLASVPLFLHFWSLQQYGLWLLIYAVPAAFSFADVGVGPVAMNRMTILAAQGRHAEANGVFQTALAVTLFATVIVTLVGLILIWGFDIGTANNTQTRATLSLLCATTLTTTYAPLFDGQFRSAGRFAAGTMAIHTGRLLEWLGGIVGLFLFRDMVAVGGGMFIARLLVTIGIAAWTRREFPQYHWGFAQASRNELRVLLPPAAAFLALPAGNALLLQGVSLVVGGTLGTGALAVFNTLRTLSRAPVQALTVFSRSLWPEMSRSYGSGNLALLRRLYQRSARGTVLACAIICLGLYMASPLILKVWTHGEIQAQPVLLGFFMISALASCMWQIEQVLLSATNTHAPMAVWYVAAAALAVLLAAALPKTWGMVPMVGALIMFEAVMLVVSRRLVAIPLRGAA